MIITGLAFYKRLIVFSILMVLAAFIHYISFRREFKINWGHVFFFAMIIAWKYGIGSSVLFVIGAGLLPEMLAGNLELKTFAIYPLQVALIMISTLFMNYNIVYVGVTLSLINYLITFLLSRAIGEPVTELITDVFIPMFLDVVYFLSLAVPLSKLLDIVI